MVARLDEVATEFVPESSFLVLVLVNSGIHLFPRQIDRVSSATPNQRETYPS
jgi:hypothetical protein